LKIFRAEGRIFFQVARAEPYVLRVSDSRGALEKEFRGRGEGLQSLAAERLPRGAHLVTLETPSGYLSRLIPNY
jgi:hypothetical protein